MSSTEKHYPCNLRKEKDIPSSCLTGFFQLPSCRIVAGMLQRLAIWQQEVSKGSATTLQETGGFYGD